MGKEPGVVGPDLTPDWLEKFGRMIAELVNQLRRGILEPGKGLTLDQLQKFLEHQNPFVTPDSKLGEWQEFYQDVFGLRFDFSNLQIPPERRGFGWLIVVARGLAMNLVFDKMSERMPTWRYTENLDQAVSKNDRGTGETYAIWARDQVEADEELKNVSARQLAERGIPGITLLERLVLELFYFWKTRGKHLDLKNITLCAGSRNSDGGVPYVRLNSDGEVGVSWCYPSESSDHLRTRSVVSA